MNRAAGDEQPRSVTVAVVPFREAFRFWLTLGFISFGGPSGQIALMHRELVERRRWISEEAFLRALNLCMLLPGPEAQQLAIYVGWLLHGTRGGLVAGVFFVLPAFFLLWALSWTYAAYGALPQVEAFFFGLRAAVVALVAEALVRIACRALRGRMHLAIALGAFAALALLAVPFPVVVLAAGLLGALLLGKPGPEPGAASGNAEAELSYAEQTPPAPLLSRAARVLAVGLLAWWLPLLAVIAGRGPDDVLSRLAVFFSKAAMVTFGGAYAVLAYVNQAAVPELGWLESGQMMDGLALAESTPGPLIMVLQFVGYLAAWRHPGGLDPALAGFLGACVTVWATFAPCFLWIFLFAPFVERLRGRPRLDAALGAITAAVVGVIAHLALVLASHTLWPAGRLDLVAWGLVASAGAVLWRYPSVVPVVVIGSGVLGLLIRGGQ